MTDRALTIDTLLRLLAQAAGAADTGVTIEEVSDTEFDLLGYDSLALLETASLVEREFDVTVGDDIASSATPGEFLAHVNDILAGRRPE
jgi:act minimal PKS acyl carrier protein